MSYHNQKRFDNRSSERNWISEFDIKWITNRIDKKGIEFSLREKISDDCEKSRLNDLYNNLKNLSQSDNQ